MYLIWNNNIWGSYRASEGWRPTRTAPPTRSAAYDTTCHRDHIHISLSWAGAIGRTSFWTGRVAPVDYGPCRPADLNWAAPYSGFRPVPCPPHLPVTAPRARLRRPPPCTAASGARLAPRVRRARLVTALQRALGLGADGELRPD